MIPRDFISEWRKHAPWISSSQVEQDLVMSRILVELFTDDTVAQNLAFRGGTALYKLFLIPAARYSEDVDLVQTRAGSIGPVLDAIRARLDKWLGVPQRKQNEGRVVLGYRFTSEDMPPLRLKIKLEINSREHFSVFGLQTRRFEVTSRWFSGFADIATYKLEELLGTKLRALYQRKKGRDLFDLDMALRRQSVAPESIIRAFERYLQADGLHITRAMFEANLAEKRADKMFEADLTPLLTAEAWWDTDAAFERVLGALIRRLPGDPWKGG